GERGDANIRRLARQRSGDAIKSTSHAGFCERYCLRALVSESYFVRCLLFACFCFLLGLISSGCTKQRDATITRDACSLVSKEEIEAVQQTPLTDAKSSERSDGPFRISQCLYSAAEFSKSVNLALIQADPKQQTKRTLK